MSYKSILVTKRGGPEALQVVENDLQPPSAGEVRVRILATPVCQDDVAARVGNRPFLPKLPFVMEGAVCRRNRVIGSECRAILGRRSRPPSIPGP